MSIKVKIDGVNAMNIGTGERVPIPFVTNENVEIVYTLDEEKFNFNYIQQKILEGKEVIVRQPLDIDAMDEIESSQMMQDFHLGWVSMSYLRFQTQTGTAFIYWDIDRNGRAIRYQGNFAYRDSVTQLESDLKDTNKSLDALWKINKGQTYDIVQQTETGMNIAPSGAKYESLISIDGKSEQNTTKGYNIGIFELTDGSTSGFTFTNLGDNTFSMVGTRTATSSKRLLSASGLTAGTYQVRVEVLSGTESITNALQFVLYDITDGGSTQLDTSLNRNTDFTIAEGITDIRINAKGRTDQATIDAVFKVWLVKSANASEPYEPYTGGIASPNPDYPQEIHSVEEINFKKIGRNQWNENWENGYFNTDGSEASSTVRIRTVDYIRVNPNLTYFFCHPYAGHLRIIFYDANKNYLTSGYARSNETLTMDSDVYYIKFCTQTADNVIEYMGNICINISDAEDGIYEPYHEENHTIIPPFALNSISDAFDLADVDKGIWVKNIEKYYLKNNTSWAKTGVNVDRYYREFSRFGIEVKNYENIISSHFYRKVGGETVGAFAVNVTSIGFAFSKKGESTSAMFSDFVNDNDVYILYETLTPTETPINSEDLKFLKSLTNLDTENTNLIITDQDGNDITYLMEYIIKLSEVN